MKMKRSWINSVLVIAAGLFLIGCEEEVYIPKPVGFYRIDLPEAEYAEYSPENCPYSFEINTKSKVQYVKG